MTLHPTLSEIAIRYDLRPGDIGTVAALHGMEYATEYRLSPVFEADAARGLADLAEAISADPAAGRMWLVEEDGGVLIGSIAVSRESAPLARLRYFLLSRAARGRGLGHRLLGVALDYARERGFETMELVTFSELLAAAHLYGQAGFELRHSEPMGRWGREIELRRYELTL
jgi:GNAT superfamily N-acetyltransferase